MSKGTLITRPNHDLATTYLFQWSKLLIKVAEDREIQILDLDSKKANLKTFQSYIEKRKPSFIFLNGHGTAETICGWDDEYLVNQGNCEKLLIGSIVYARSCKAGSILGHECIKTGTRAFVGYSRDFIIGYSEERETKPLTDNIAKLFLEPSNLLALNLMLGWSVKEAVKKSQDLMTKNLSYMLSSKATMDERDAAPYLWSNIKYQVVLGNDQASIG